MKYKYNGVTEAIVMTLGVTIQPGDIVDVPEELEKRFEADPQFDAVGSKTTPKPAKPVKGDK